MTERRRSLIFDGTHYRINLPKDFIKEKGWKKGDEISIIDENGHLLIKNATKKKTSPIVFSIGYEGKSLMSFIEILLENNIAQLIDIRENPISRKPGFSKKALRKALSEAGISYKNIKDLGTDKLSRDRYKETGNIKELLKIYEKQLVKKEDYYEILKTLVNFRPSAIMCFEDDHKKCHRQSIEYKLVNDGFRVEHLCNGKQKRC